jgi:signal transduction histidine kinase
MGAGDSIQSHMLSDISAKLRPDTGDTEPASFSSDLQSLLSGALQHLAETTGSTRACAWARRQNGETFVVAAAYRDGTNPEPPDAEAIAALDSVYRSDRPIDLGEDGPASPAGAMARRYGVSSAMPLLSLEREPIALLMLGGPNDAPGHVRPRTLAALGAAVDRLHSPAVAAAAFSRLNRLDADVCRLDRLAALGDLLAEVAHEIRNPLVSLKTFLDLLPDNLSDPAFHGEFRGLALQELKRMERLLDTILDHARPVANPANPTIGYSGHEASRIEQVFSSIVRLLEQRASERNVELSSVIDANLPEAAIDGDALRQVLLNLVLNALEASPPSGKVTLHARGTDGGLEFSVEDEGSGVSEALRAKLFEPFFTTRDNRTGGLGLAISKKLVEEAGGSIRVEQGSKDGARFCVQLPGRTRSG